MPDDPGVPLNQVTVPQPPSEGDGEIKAMNAVVAALKPLRDDERRRVLEYVLGRFGAVPLQAQVTPLSVPSATLSPAASPTTAGGIYDIRTLKETKAPRSANEMAALVAYYVSELAPPAEKKQEINKTDIERYFKSAGFKLTAKAGQTLINARHAGYLDAGSDTGQYKLNPVGYNLVVHRLGGDSAKHRRRRAHNEKNQPRRSKR
jgi:hypothetical protein